MDFPAPAGPETRIVLPFGTLKALPTLIQENVKKIKRELKNQELPQKKVETKSTNASYLG